MYGKTFSKLWRGSMRAKPNLQLVFIYMFCNCDSNGIFDAMPAEISDATGLPIQIVLECISELEAPDKNSRTTGHEGRRILRVDQNRTWGWQIINHGKYREEGTRRQHAERQKRYRAKRCEGKRHSTVTHRHASSRPVSVSVSESISDSVSDCVSD